VHPHILCKHKLLFWMQLIAINRLTALIYIYSKSSSKNYKSNPYCMNWAA